MADKGTLQEIQEKLKKIWGKIKMLAFVYLILLLLAFVLCIIVYFMVSNSPGTFTVGKETFRTDGKFILEKSIYQNFENLLLGGIVNDIPQGGI
ncbi:MAG: hypothetical protein O3A66_00730, partial [Proteobacteria bacterium]|nr:hypothetical protein [Pseudomonadota bacterium]